MPTRMNAGGSLIPCAAAAALLAAAGQAAGQTPCRGSRGPDVIVGDVTGPANYSAQEIPAGSGNWVEALSLGTTSCNMGDTWLNWIANTNQHPVIAGSLFRMKRDSAASPWRFEQVGQSWLKHGFYALSQNLCCAQCTATDGTHLGIGCSDPYTADRNGTQGNLGPKWQVNVQTGFFNYPPANPPYSGSVARRLQVKTSELQGASLSTPDVAYYGQAQYVSPDDAAAGNHNNNASYRRVAVSGSGAAWNFSFLGSTVRESPAIRVWRNVDSAVTERTVQVANDGYFIVSSRATDLGNGMWHYEYAAYNLTSDRCANTFSVPLPDNATVTNIGFHDVDYHSGDGPGNANYSGVDWTPTHSDGAMTWATETYTQNQSANAIRWGTLYNFRFDANVPPASAEGVATLGIFKPGIGTAFTAAAQVPGVLPGPACPCDFSGDGSMSSQDFFDYLAAFFGGVPAADYNLDGSVNSQDFFEFLSCFFTPPAGC